VENAVRQRAFHERRALPANQRAKIGRDRDAVLSRLARFVKRGALREVALDMDTAINEARHLSTTHSERAIDLLHVACAVLLQSESFLTFDQRQAALAEAAGMKVYSLSDQEG
jgi:predicted nucleic acid-binding protein